MIILIRCQIASLPDPLPSERFITFPEGHDLRSFTFWCFWFDGEFLVIFHLAVASSALPVLAENFLRCQFPPPNLDPSWSVPSASIADHTCPIVLWSSLLVSLLFSLGFSLPPQVHFKFRTWIEDQHFSKDTQQRHGQSRSSGTPEGEKPPQESLYPQQATDCIFEC